MKQTRIILISSAVLVAIIVILLYNKSRMAAEAKSDVMSSIPVSVTTAGKEQISETQSLVGIITANNDVAIVAETAGKVTQVLAEVGKHVSAGETLLQLDDELKRAALASAESANEKAKNDLERFESLSKQNAATDQQLEGARLAAKAADAQFITVRRQFNDTRIKTPISGIVTSRLVDLGAYVQSNAVVANVVDISRLKVRVNVAEQDVFGLKTGDKVRVETDVYPGTGFEGIISTIGSKADEAHTYPVEIRVDNPAEHPLKAGMFGRVVFTRTGSGAVVTIPREALVGSTRNAHVFVVEGGKAKLRSLVVGGESGMKILVVSGLNGGETIVTNGQNNLKDDVPVTVIR
jgi:RND family efflux transporter MFP subunit